MTISNAHLLYPQSLVCSPVPPPGVQLEENVHVPMRDGVKLTVDVYSSGKPGAYPVLLSVSPYSKDIQQKPPQWSHAIEAGATGFYVSHGYIHVVAQGRGAGYSQGKWGFFHSQERTDGYDLIEWIAQQPWCDGNVGMIGDSYWSWSQYHAAAQQPPHLRCICQCDGTTDLYRDLAYPGGVYNAEFMDTWISYHTKMAAWPGAVPGKEPPMNLTWEVAMHPTDDAFWQERSARTYLDRIQVPVMSISPQGVPIHMRGQLWGYPRINSPKKLLVVPPTGFWSHVHYLTNPALNAQMLRWFNHWMKGQDTGIMDEPEVAIFDSATRTWRHETAYPLARTEWTKLHLQANGGLSPSPAPESEPDSYRLPDSLAQLLANKPVLAYATPPMPTQMRLWGPVSLTLYAASSQPDTVFHAKLFDVAPDGASRNLSRGILRASFRRVVDDLSAPGQPWHPFDRQELLNPGEVTELQIEMRPMFHTIRQGHVLQLTLASEDIAFSNKQRTIDVQLLPWPVENQIYHSPGAASHLLVPVIPDAPDIAPVGQPVRDIAWNFTPEQWSADTEGWPLKA